MCPGGKRAVASLVSAGSPAPTECSPIFHLPLSSLRHLGGALHDASCQAGFTPTCELICGLPAQFVQFALVRPGVRAGYQPSTNRILPRVFPFLVVVTYVTKLRIPEIELPNWLILRSWPSPRSQGFPVAYPLPNVPRRCLRRRAKQVQVVGHDDKSSDHPTGRRLPRFHQQFHRIFCGKEAFASRGADRQVNDDRLVPTFNRRGMRRAGSLPHHETGS